MVAIFNFLMSACWTLVSVIWIDKVIIKDLPLMIESLSKTNTFILAFQIFVLFAIVSFGIAYIIKAIQHMYLFLCYTFFKEREDYTEKYKSVTVEIDENNFINKSYIEFMNGQKIPFLISRMVAPTIQEVKKENTEVKENNE